MVMGTRIKTLAILMAISTLALHAQRPFEKQPLAYFGIHFADAITCSGHGNSINLGACIEKGRKSLQFGTIYEFENSAITGGEMVYKQFLFHKKQSDESAITHTFVPYLKYNFIYRSSDPNNQPQNAENSNLKSMSTGKKPVEPTGKISSIEHFIGAGFQLKIISNLFFDTNIGFGSYIGSINRNNIKEAGLGVHKSNSGFGLSGEAGLTYKLGH
jgi:hypothetical protein